MYNCRSCHPPPTRTITFFVAVLDSPLAPARLRVVNLHVTVFRVNEFEKAYCARISSPSRGIVLSGGSTRSINKPCAIELTIAATSASSGSRGFPGLYRYDEFAEPPPPKLLSRDDGRDDGVRGAGVDDDVSRKLDGGSFALINDLFGRGLLLLLLLLPLLPLPALMVP